ncbi:MAG TPA: thioredoxin family protein [Casimicrobiaceae bacterium]|nr:thioredoxin family protein [Casimicrobiaceae bacterium]
MKKVFALALSFLVLVCTAANAELPAKFDPSRDAAADVAYAVSLAKRGGKRVIVDVGGEWCSWCHIMDRFIAANADVRSLIDANYIWVKVNFSKENRNEALLAHWPKIEGYPHLFFLDPNGALVHSQDTSLLESAKGYDRQRFLAMLRRFAPAKSMRI